MKAMVLNGVSSFELNKEPLQLADIPVPEAGDREVLIRISVCGVCHTELDEIEGRTPPKQFPMVLGHQVVGKVAKLGGGASKFKIGDRVGVAWIFSACGKCRFCTAGYENLCDGFLATGRDVNGGYAQFMTALERYTFAIPDSITDTAAAPLLCAGAIGYRSIQLTHLKDGQKLGLTGFGASAHLILKMVRHRYPKTQVYVFARNGQERDFAKELGAVWTGESSDSPPQKLDCIIDTTPAWKPAAEALRNLEKGGRLVINAIRKEDTDKGCLQNLSYSGQLWLEKEIKTVANITGRDVADFLQLAAEIGLHPEVELYPLEDANKALADMKEKRIRGAKVLQIP